MDERIHLIIKSLEERHSIILPRPTLAYSEADQKLWISMVRARLDVAISKKHKLLRDLHGLPQGTYKCPKKKVYNDIINNMRSEPVQCVLNKESGKYTKSPLELSEILVSQYATPTFTLSPSHATDEEERCSENFVPPEWLRPVARDIPSLRGYRDIMAEVTPSEITSRLNKMKGSSSPGHDLHRTTLLKIACSEKWYSINMPLSGERNDSDS